MSENIRRCGFCDEPEKLLNPFGACEKCVKEEIDCES